MFLRFSLLALAANFLVSEPLVFALSAADIPSDIPVSSLLSSANGLLAKGETNDALIYYDAAISRDPNNYLTYFRRGATYLSLGRNAQAQSDFDKVLSIKPGFEGALLQRARIKSKNGEWEAGRQDYVLAGKTAGTELAEMEEAQGAARLAMDAEKRGDYEECVTQAGVAIMVASKSLLLRQLRVRCRFARGEVQEGISDLSHVLQLQPGLTDPHLQIAAVRFFALKDTEKGAAQIRKCLHSDPDSKSCKKLHRMMKRLEKDLSKLNGFFERRQFSSAVKILSPNEGGIGLVQEVKDEEQELRAAGTIPALAPSELIASLVEMACEAYTEMNSKKAVPLCDEALQLNEFSLHGLLSKAQRLMDAEEYQPCINILNIANEHHPGNQKVASLLQSAQIAFKRSKEKDYYKVLGLPKDADEMQIRAAYKRMTKTYHPDKAMRMGVSKEVAEKKMAAINEAYEVLKDPELKARFDRGDDPNSTEQQGNPFHGSPFGGGQQFFHQQQGGGGQQFQFKFPGGAGGFPFG